MVRQLLRQNAAQIQRVIFCAVKTAYKDGPKPLEFCTLGYCFITSGAEVNIMEILYGEIANCIICGDMYLI